MPYDTTYIVIPAHEEERSVGAVVAGLYELPHVRVIVVDDASRDNTAVEARRAGAEVISLCTRLGAWRATQAGMRRALFLGAKRVATVDADGQHTPKSVGILLEEGRERKKRCSDRCGSGERICIPHVGMAFAPQIFRSSTPGSNVGSKSL